MVTSPADGMAAAPIAAKVAVTAMTHILPNSRTTPCACKGTGYAALPRKDVMVLSAPRKDYRHI